MPQTDPAVTKIIEGRHAEFGQLFNAKKFDRIATTYYAVDAKLLPPNAPIQEGRAAIQAFLTEAGKVFAEIKPRTQSVLVQGDLLVTTGIYTAKLKTPDGSLIDDRGKFVEAFRRKPDGSWESIIDTFNSDLPIPGSE